MFPVIKPACFFLRFCFYHFPILCHDVFSAFLNAFFGAFLSTFSMGGLREKMLFISLLRLLRLLYSVFLG